VHLIGHSRESLGEYGVFACMKSSWHGYYGTCAHVLPCNMHALSSTWRQGYHQCWSVIEFF
jgi:hypothetical protein